MTKTMDKSIDLLINQLAVATGHWLIVADENWPQTIWSTIPKSHQRTVEVITNRFDVAQAVKQAAIDCQFTDFDFSVFNPASYDGVIYRVSKERATSHHVINQAASRLIDHMMTGSALFGYAVNHTIVTSGIEYRKIKVSKLAVYGSLFNSLSNIEAISDYFNCTLMAFRYS